MSKPRSIPQIIDAFGGATAFGRVIDVKPSTASEMKRRRNIPVQYWPKISGAQPVEGAEVTYDELVAAHCLKDEAA